MMSKRSNSRREVSGKHFARLHLQAKFGTLWQRGAELSTVMKQEDCSIAFHLRIQRRLDEGQMAMPENPLLMPD
jgi:hypothetical protein